MTNHLRYLLFLYAIFAGIPCTRSQEIETDMVYDFSESSDTMRSNIQFVYADTGIIIVAGNILDDTGGVQQPILPALIIQAACCGSAGCRREQHLTSPAPM